MEYQQRGSITSKQYTGDRMVTISSRLYSEDEMLDLMREFHGDARDWPRKNGFRPRRDWGGNKYSSTYPLYYIAFDGDKPIAFGGFEDNGKFIVSAGMSVHQDYRRKGVANRLITKRNDKYSSMNKPALVAVNTKSMGSGDWKSKWTRTGWIDSPEDSEISEEDKLAIPSEVLEYHRKRYGDNWMLLPVGSKPMAKAWSILYKGDFSWK